MLEHAARYSFGVISQVIIMEYIRLSSARKKNKTIKKQRIKAHDLEITHTFLPMIGFWIQPCCWTSWSHMSRVRSSPGCSPSSSSPPTSFNVVYSMLGLQPLPRFTHKQLNLSQCFLGFSSQQLDPSPGSLSYNQYPNLNQIKTLSPQILRLCQFQTPVFHHGLDISSVVLFTPDQMDWMQMLGHTDMICLPYCTLSLAPLMFTSTFQTCPGFSSYLFLPAPVELLSYLQGRGQNREYTILGMTFLWSQRNESPLGFCESIWIILSSSFFKFGSHLSSF